MAEQQRCETCRWWLFVNNYGGSCKRYPPTVTARWVGGVSAYEHKQSLPWMPARDWCGEWTAPPGGAHEA